MKLKSKLTDQDMSELIHIYDELKDYEPIVVKNFNAITMKNVIDMSIALHRTIMDLEKLLMDTGKDSEQDEEDEHDLGSEALGRLGLAMLAIWNDSFSKASECVRTNSDEEEEDCSCQLVKELVDENERLKNRVWNLNTYLDRALYFLNPTTRVLIMDSYSGMPGYNAREAAYNAGC